MKGMKSNIEILSPDEILQIHRAALNVLAKTGFHMPNNECLKRCQKAGAVVDPLQSVVWIPVSVMEDLLAEMKRHADLQDAPTPTLAGSISTQVFVTDYMSKTRRYGTSDDIMRGISLVEHLKNIPSCNAVTVPADVDSRISDLHAYMMLLKYATKPGGTYILSADSAEFIMDTGDTMGRKEYYLFESVSPLRFRKETLDIGLRFANRGHGLSIAPMIMGGTTGPSTMAGTLTLIVAEVLASIFSVHAISGQLIAFFGHGSHYNDPRTLLCSFGSPNQALIGIGTAQMAKFYGIQGGSNSALSDALVPDFQCGFEKTFSAVMSSLAGSVSIGCQGIVGADQGFSFEQLIIDNEWLDAWNYVVAGIEVNEETIAEELIHEVGIGGNFIAEEHTAMHIRENWWPSKIFFRDSYDAWQAAGKKDSLDRAHELLEGWTINYRNPKLVISAAKADELDRIYAQAMAKILK